MFNVCFWLSIHHLYSKDWTQWGQVTRSCMFEIMSSFRLMFLCHWQTHLLTTCTQTLTFRRASLISALGALVFLWKHWDYIQWHQYTTCSAQRERGVRLGQRSPTSQRQQRLIDAECNCFQDHENFPKIRNSVMQVTNTNFARKSRKNFLYVRGSSRIRSKLFLMPCTTYPDNFMEIHSRVFP